jgi:hypothetical protein
MRVRGIECCAGGAFDVELLIFSIRPKNSTAWASFAALEAPSTSAAERRIPRISSTAVRTVDVRTSFGAGDLRFVCKQYFLCSLVEFNVLWLRRSATVAELSWSVVFAITMRASPSEFYVSNRFSRHTNPPQFHFNIGATIYLWQ